MLEPSSTLLSKYNKVMLLERVVEISQRSGMKKLVQFMKLQTMNIWMKVYCFEMPLHLFEKLFRLPFSCYNHNYTLMLLWFCSEEPLNYIAMTKISHLFICINMKSNRIKSLIKQMWPSQKRIWANLYVVLEALRTDETSILTSRIRRSSGQLFPEGLLLHWFNNVNPIVMDSWTITLESFIID